MLGSSEPDRLVAFLGDRIGYLARVDRPEVGLVPVQVALLRNADALAEDFLCADGNVGYRVLDALGFLLGDLGFGEETGHVAQAERSFGQADDDGLHLREQLDSGQNDDPLGAEHPGPECVSVVAVVAVDLQVEGMRSLQKVLHDLFGRRQVVAIDVEPVRLYLVEHVRSEHPNELSLVQIVTGRLVRDGEVVALQPDAIGVGGHQVGTAKEPVVRVLATVAGTTVLRVHQRQLVDNLVRQHLELRPAEHEVVRTVTEDSDGHVNVVARQNPTAQVVLVGQHLECSVDVVAHAAGGVETNLDRHRTADGELEQPIGLLFEPQQRTTNDAVLGWVHERVELASSPDLLLRSLGRRPTARHVCRRCCVVRTSGERVTSHLLVSFAQATFYSGSVVNGWNVRP